MKILVVFLILLFIQEGDYPSFLDVKVHAVAEDDRFDNAVKQMNAGRFKEANVILLEMYSGNPKYPCKCRLAKTIAFNLAQLNNRDKATDWFSHAITLAEEHEGCPHFDAIIRCFAEEQVCWGDDWGAIRTLNHPGSNASVGAHQILANTYLKVGKPLDAIFHAKRTLELGPSLTQRVIAMRDWRNASTRAGYKDEAKQVNQAIVDLVSKYIDESDSQLARLKVGSVNGRQDIRSLFDKELFACGEFLYNIEDYQGAIATINQRLKIAPEWHKYSWRAGVYSKLGNYDRAAADYKEAKALSPNGSTRFKIEIWEKKNVDIPIRQAEMRRFVVSNNLRTQRQAYIEQYNKSRELQHLDVVIAIDNVWPPKQKSYGRQDPWYVKQRKLLGLKAYAEVIAMADINDQNVKVRHNAGVAYALLGDYTSALTQYKRCEKRDWGSDMTTRLNNMAVCFKALNNDIQYIATLEEIEKTGSEVAVKKAQERLRPFRLAADRKKREEQQAQDVAIESIDELLADINDITREVIK